MAPRRKSNHAKHTAARPSLPSEWHGVRMRTITLKRTAGFPIIYYGNEARSAESPGKTGGGPVGGAAREQRRPRERRFDGTFCGCWGRNAARRAVLLLAGAGGRGSGRRRGGRAKGGGSNRLSLRQTGRVETRWRHEVCTKISRTNRLVISVLARSSDPAAPPSLPHDQRRCSATTKIHGAAGVLEGPPWLPRCGSGKREMEGHTHRRRGPPSRPRRLSSRIFVAWIRGVAGGAEARALNA